MIWPEILSLRSFRQTHWNNIYWLHILAAGQWKLGLMWHWRLYPCLKGVNGFDLGKGGKRAESLSKGKFSNMALPDMNSPWGHLPLTWMSTDEENSYTWLVRNEPWVSSLILLWCHLGKRSLKVIFFFFQVEKVERSCFSGSTDKNYTIVTTSRAVGEIWSKSYIPKPYFQSSIFPWVLWGLLQVNSHQFVCSWITSLA